MGSTAYAAYNNGAANANSPHTVTALGRWSILNKQLPAVGKIKAIHVYDFDNTRMDALFILIFIFLVSPLFTAADTSAQL